MIEALGEAIALVSKAGIDRAQYVDLLTATLFGAPVYKTYGALIAEERYQPAGFKAELGYKDVRLALSAREGSQSADADGELDLRSLPCADCRRRRRPRLVGARPPRQARRRRDDDARRLPSEAVMAVIARAQSGFARARAKTVPLCPRLVAFRKENERAHPDWFNGAVPSFGADHARLLIVGLAPGLKGANRTGRPFLGDYAGELLYRTLLKVGLARGRHDVAAPDESRAGRLHDHQRGALRAAGEQAEARPRSPPAASS